MLLTKKTFFKPTKQTRILIILNEIERNSGISQAKLARKAGISVAMANNYIKELQEQGLLRANGDNNRRTRYTLTEKGENLQRELSLCSSAEVIQMYGATKKVFNAKFRQMHREGVRRVALFGAAETAEVATAAARGTQVEVVAVIDNDRLKQGTAFGNLTVAPPEILDVIQIDAVIITSFAHQVEIARQISHLAEQGIKVETL
jgi:predicted transcriptional regulator